MRPMERPDNRIRAQCAQQGLQPGRDHGRAGHRPVDHPRDRAQLYAFFEGQKRTTSSGADAQTNSAVAMYLLERDLRQAGYGIQPNLEDFSNGALATGVLAQCGTVDTYNSARTAGGDLSPTPIPIFRRW